MDRPDPRPTLAQEQGQASKAWTFKAKAKAINFGVETPQPGLQDYITVSRDVGC